MAENESTWDKWVGIAKKDPWKAMDIVGSTALESTVEVFAEIGEATGKVAVGAVAIPILAIQAAAKGIKRASENGGNTIRYGIRQLKPSVEPLADEVERAERSIGNHLATSDHFAESILDPLAEEANRQY